MKCVKCGRFANLRLCDSCRATLEAITRPVRHNTKAQFAKWAHLKPNNEDVQQ